MKSASFFLILLLSFLFLSCEKSKYNPEYDPPFADWGPPSFVTIVKFSNNEHANKVILQNPIKEYDEDNNRYVYYNNLYLNIRLGSYSWNGVSTSLANWADEEMQIAGSSPYIPLTDGYYLIDWKWHQLHPISARSIRFDLYENHIYRHCFITDIDWHDLQNLTDGYDASLYTQNVCSLEIIRVQLFYLHRFYHDVKRPCPYLCYGYDLYHFEGMCLENVYAYYKKGDCSDSGKTYLTYIAYCDSLQSIDQQRLIELIKNGKIKDLCY